MGVAENVVYTWHGERTIDGKNWREFYAGIPTRDLTEQDVDRLDKTQKANLKSENGKRLYHAVESKPAAKAEDKGGN